MSDSVPAHGGDVPGAPAYSAQPFFLLRAATLPVQVATDVLTQFPAGHDDTVRLQEAAQEFWAKPVVRTAVTVASSDLAAAMENWTALAERDRIRAARGLLRYVNRMSSRATPFGLMASVTSGSITDAEAASVTLQRDEDNGVVARVRARADMGLVLEMLRSAVEENSSADELLVRANDLAHTGRGRIWLPNTESYGANKKRSMSLRLTTAVKRVLNEARTPTTLGNLRRCLSEAYPGVPSSHLDHLLQQLVDLNLLISAHRPRLIHDRGYDPLDDLPSHMFTENKRQELKEFSAQIANCNEAPGLAGVLPLVRHSTNQSVVDTEYDGPPLQFDAVLGTSPQPVLPATVATLAAEAANVLAIVGSDRRYPQHLADWATAFTAHYGIGAEVPVLEALSEETGLGPPTRYHNPRRSYALEPDTKVGRKDAREVLLIRLISQALAERSLEVELNDEWLAAFAHAMDLQDDPRPAVPALDVYLELWTGDDVGEPWTAAVTEMALGRGGRTFARFYDLLERDARQQLQTLADVEQQYSENATIVELAYLPSIGRSLNVSLRPRIREFELPINVTANTDETHTVSLDDINVGVRAGYLYLRSRRMNCTVLLTQSTMLSAASSPNVCRFLQEVSSAAFRGATSFDWGAAAVGAPFLPRLRSGGVIIRRASWQLSPEQLSPELPDAEFRAALEIWADKWMMPSRVHLVEGDNHLLLDMNSSLSIYELRRALKSARAAKSVAPVRLVEIGPGSARRFLRDQHNMEYAAEVVVPVVTARSRPARAIRRSGGRRYISPHERLRPPGGEWLYLKLYAESDAADDILTVHLPALSEQLCGEHRTGRPFFLRYSDPLPHLRIRFPVPLPESRGPALAAAAQWSHRLIDQGVATDVAFPNYHREIERYGGPDLIEEAERLFAVDSDAVIAILDYCGKAAEEDLSREAIGALTLERIARTLVPDLAERRAVVRSVTSGDAGSVEYRSEAGDLWNHHSLCGPTAPLLRSVADRWLEPGERFRRIMAETQIAGQLWDEPHHVIHALLHMHCNRLGLQGNRENVAYGIWRRLLDREAATRRSHKNR